VQDRYGRFVIQHGMHTTPLLYGDRLYLQLFHSGARWVVALDNNETGLFELAASLPAPTDPGRLRLRIGDITDQPTMLGVLAAHRPDVVFHAAAYKHVPLLEEHPAQAARINVLGTYDLCRLCTDLGVGVFVFVSSDKAADPVNVLGASKRLGELIVQAMASGSGGGTTRFCAVRFGNVIGSRGSVVPTFVRQLEHGGPVTVTDARATRYFMTIAECGLVILTATVSDAGGTYLLDMGAPVRIAELAEKIIRLRGLRVDVDVPIAYTGLRAGERLHEVLLGAGESLGDGPHPKVARIAGLNGPPARRAVAAWARELRAGLDGDEVWLRQRLLELSHGGAASPPPERAGTAGAGRRPAVSRRV